MLAIDCTQLGADSLPFSWLWGVACSLTACVACLVAHHACPNGVPQWCGLYAVACVRVCVPIAWQERHAYKEKLESEEKKKQSGNTKPDTSALARFAPKF